MGLGFEEILAIAYELNPDSIAKDSQSSSQRVIDHLITNN